MGLSIDRENTISNLETNIRWIEDMECHQFPGWGNVTMAMRDALELLKEQEAVKPLKSKLSFTHGFDWEIWDCGCCGNQLRSFAKYCDQCGQAVKWE